MRLAAALILSLMAVGVVADEPRSVIFYGDEQGLHGDRPEADDRVRQPRAGGASNQALTIWDYEHAVGPGPVVPDFYRQGSPIHSGIHDIHMNQGSVEE